MNCSCRFNILINKLAKHHTPHFIDSQPKCLHLFVGGIPNELNWNVRRWGEEKGMSVVAFRSIILLW